ncbi:hypothetical protein [Pseudotabrizicola sp. L79]
MSPKHADAFIAVLDQQMPGWRQILQT